MTEENLRRAFAGESQAQVRYQEFAEKADGEGYGNVARLFRATSFAEQVHAALHLRVLADVGTTLENLARASETEAFEAQQMYPAYVEVAKLQGEDDARRTLEWTFETEKTQVNLYQEASSAVDAGRDVELLAIFVCPDCGYIAKDQPPERCPLSGTPGYQFRGF